MLRKWAKRVLVFLLTILGIFMISHLPYLFIKNFKPVQLILMLIDTGQIENGDFL